jgi:MFS family permease
MGDQDHRVGPAPHARRRPRHSLEAFRFGPAAPDFAILHAARAAGRENPVTASDLSADPRKALYAKIGWRLIPLLIVVYISAFIDRSNIAVAKLEFMGDLGLTEAAYGLAGGLFYLGYCLFEVPSNLVLARVGAKRTIMRIMILWSLCSAAFALITQPWHFFSLRFLLGAAEAGLFPGVLFYLSQWAPAARRARFTALFMSAMALSGVITGPISGAIMANSDGVGGLHAWQWLFLVEGLPGVALAIIVHLLLTDTPAQAAWLTETEKAIVHADLAAEAAARKPVAGLRWTSVFKDRRFYALAMMAMALLGTINGISLWVPTVIRKSGVAGILQVSLLSSVPYIVAVIVQQLVARSSDKRQERTFHAAVPALIAAAGWLILPQVKDSPALSLLVLCLIAAGTFGATGPFWSLPATLLAGSASATGIAMVTTSGGVAAFLSPIIVGWATDRTGDLAAGQYFYAALIAIAAVGLVLLTRKRRLAEPVASPAVR